MTNPTIGARSTGDEMLKDFWRKISAFWAKPAARSDAGHDWRADPLGHPALHQMSQRELADLPIEPDCFR